MNLRATEYNIKYGKPIERKYRYLKRDEIMEKGDQFYSSSELSWCEVSVGIGQSVDIYIRGTRVRRPI
jgi:hypothetical protein